MNSKNYIETNYNHPFISQRADPYVYKHTDGKYYFCASVPEYDCIAIRSADTLEGLACSSEKIIWKKHEQGIMSIHIWAPEIHYINGEWCIYFAGGEKEDVWKIRPYVLKCEGNNPMKDKWVELGSMRGVDAFCFQDFSLDMTVFSHKGKNYCVWAEKVSIGKKISNLYIAELKTLNQLGTEIKLLTTPDYEWERVGFWVNEGPAVIKHDGRIFLTYSASETGECYCMGLLSISEEDDVLNPRAWMKKKQPVLTTSAEYGLYGPGHNSFTKSEDNMTDIMIYHARQYDEIIGNPLYDHNRHAYRMKIVWNSNGEPVFDFRNNY